MSEELVLAAVSAAAVSGIPGLFLRRGSNAGQRISTALQLVASGLGLSAALLAFFRASDRVISLPLSVSGTKASIAVDPLSAAFLLPVLFISGVGAVYGEEYWRQSENPRNGRKLRLFYGLLTAGLALLVVARDGVCFLFGWEVMALSAFFVVVTEDEKDEVREAGWIYFASTHVSTLVLFGFFALLYLVKGSLRLEPFAPGEVPEGAANALFLLALAGFGLKAGIFPLHFWLPPAHAAAPSHVSALMSGVLIKMGIYGLLRVAWLFPQVPAWWGPCLLGLGCVSGVFGVAFAIGQHDMKRLLAYHSIENIGIICMGVGLALAGRALGRAEWVALGLGGAVLHTWNHGLFKALLFLAAGSAIHAVHTREIDDLGGLSKSMPITACCFLVGAVSICGLPPLNGFVSELLIYLGLFQAGLAQGDLDWRMGLFAVPILSLIGALALACFVKVFGAVFLGTPRREHPAHVRESGPAMTVPMVILASVCAAIGLAPWAIAPLLDAVAERWAGGGAHGPSLASVAPLGWLTWTGCATLAACLLGSIASGRGARTPVHARPGTWDCGYVRLEPTMQYTASSFAQGIVGLLSWVLLPKGRAARPQGKFPAPVAFHSRVPDAILDRLILPAFGGLAWACSWFRLLQRGKVNAYLLYIFITLLILLLWK